jgi:hypothetical protein
MLHTGNNIHPTARTEMWLRFEQFMTSQNCPRCQLTERSPCFLLNSPLQRPTEYSLSFRTLRKPPKQYFKKCYIYLKVGADQSTYLEIILCQSAAGGEGVITTTKVLYRTDAMLTEDLKVPNFRLRLDLRFTASGSWFLAF